MNSTANADSPDLPLPAATALSPGTLYLVATPIGNLEDITARALRTLRQVDLVAAEDTRRSGWLLRHFQIERPLVSCFQHNERRRTAEILARLQTGGTVALVTDAGTPAISDPGERLVRAVLDAGLRVESVPGPCALIAALTASGLPTAEFHFAGFLPHKSGQRDKTLRRLLAIETTLVLYESPHRILKLAGELLHLCPDRTVVLARELTKRFEEFIRCPARELPARLRGRSTKGEFVVCIEAGAPPDPAPQNNATPQPPDLP